MWKVRIVDTVLPADERVSRRELIAAADRYFDVVTGGERSSAHDGLGNFFHPDCQRAEMATIATNSRVDFR